MNKSKNLRSLATNHRKKKGIIVGCTIGGVAAIGLAVGLGIGLTQCNKLPTLSASHHTIGRENATITFTVQNIKNTSSIYWSISNENQLAEWNLDWHAVNDARSAVLRWTGTTQDDLPASEIHLSITAQVDKKTLTSSIMVESNPFKPSKTDITTIIINTNILQINSNSPSDIWKGIQDANPNLPVNINEGIFNWGTPNSDNVTLDVKPNDPFYKGTLYITFAITPPVPVKTDINRVIMNTNIGTIASVNDTYIWLGIVAVNTNLPSDVDAFIFDWWNLTRTPSGADLSVYDTDPNYTGTLQLEFIVSPVIAQSHLEIQGGVLKGFIGAYDSSWGNVLQVLDNVNSIDGMAFYACQITNLDLNKASNLKRIETAAFNNSATLSGVLTIPSSVTYIGQQAFNNCYSLTGLDLTGANNLKIIDDGAFAFCTGISGKMTIPSSVTYLGNDVFNNCGNIDDISVTGTNFGLANNVGAAKILIPYNAGNLEFNYVDPSLTPIAGGLAIGKLTVPGNVDSIGWDAFSSTYLTGLDLSSATNLKIIDKAFANCRKLSGTLTIPSSVVDISYMAFDSCVSLTHLDLSKAINLTTIGTSAFNNCRNLSGTLTIPTNVTDIGIQSFMNCAELETLNISQVNRIATIGAQAFSYCSNLSSIITNFDSAPTCFGTDVFEGVKDGGTIQNIDKAYTSANMLNYLEINCGLPYTWNAAATIDVQYLITDLELGNITSSSDDDIITGINTKNGTSFANNDLIIVLTGANSATINGTGAYTGSVRVTFTT